MNNLSIQIIINPQYHLVSVDNTHYNNFIDDITNYVSFEFLSYVDEGIQDDRTIVFKEYLNKRSNVGDFISEIEFPKDGTWTYYKYMIPKIDHFIKNTVNGYEFIAFDEVFFHGNKIYKYCGEDSFVSDNYNDINPNLIISNSIEITNLLDIWNLQNNNLAIQTLSFQKIIFSVCYLQKCLVNLQRQILNGNKSCLDCDLDKSIKYKRDFLLSSLYVFDYLKDRNNFDEAQRILDNMTSCSDYCLDTNINNCNCGTVI